MLGIIIIGSCITVIDRRRTGWGTWTPQPPGPSPAPPLVKVGVLRAAVEVGRGSWVLAGTFLCERLC